MKLRCQFHSVDEQQKYVELFNSIEANQKTYENSLFDLQMICNTYMDNLSNFKRKLPIGKLIEIVDQRNLDLEIEKLLGINVKKEFMPSKANITETDLSKYKIISRGQFVYSAMQVGRDETVRVVLYSDDDPAIVSPAYIIFRLQNNITVLSEFLMLWFYRPEFNRYGWFISDSSVRASLEWDRFCEIEIPIPDLVTQESIVSIYNTLQTRKRINEQLKESIKPLCPILMKGVADQLNSPIKEKAYDN